MNKFQLQLEPSRRNQLETKCLTSIILILICARTNFCIMHISTFLTLLTPIICRCDFAFIIFGKLISWNFQLYIFWYFKRMSLGSLHLLSRLWRACMYQLNSTGNIKFWSWVVKHWNGNVFEKNILRLWRRVVLRVESFFFLSLERIHWEKDLRLGCIKWYISTLYRRTRIIANV